MVPANQPDQQPLHYEVHPVLLREVGPVLAVVHAILLASDTGDGSMMTHRQVAKAAGITHIMARRSIDKLREEGLLKSEAQFQANRQQANRYQIPTVGTLDRNEQTPAQIEQPNRYLSIDVVGEEIDNSSPRSSSSNLSIAGQVPGETPDLEPGEGLRPSIPVADAREIEIEERQELSKRVLPSKNTPMPVSRSRKSGHKNIFDVHAEALWLVSYFEGHVLEKTNVDRKERGWKPQTTVGDKRREPWLADAVKFLGGRHAPDLSEVRLVVDWLFTKKCGFLPFRVAGYQGRWGTFADRKVTNIEKFADNYHQLLASMHTGGPDDPAEEKKSKPRDFYNDGVGFPMEDEVTELVEIFAKSRCRGEVRDFDRYAWKKSFRIMLFHREIPFEDVKMVVTAVAERRLELDFGRYGHAYDLHRDGRWQYTMASVQTALKREEMRKARRPEPAKTEPTIAGSWAWEDGPRYSRDDDDGPSCIDMATNVEERRRSYAARAARRAVDVARTP